MSPFFTYVYVFIPVVRVESPTQNQGVRKLLYPRPPNQGLVETPHPPSSALTTYPPGGTQPLENEPSALGLEPGPERGAFLASKLTGRTPRCIGGEARAGRVFGEPESPQDLLARARHHRKQK